VNTKLRRRYEKIKNPIDADGSITRLRSPWKMIHLYKADVKYINNQLDQKQQKRQQKSEVTQFDPKEKTF